MTARAQSRAWPTLLLYVAAVMLTTKLAAAAVLVRDGGSLSPLLALIPGLWPDVLLWAGLWWSTRALHRRRVVWALLPAAVAYALFSAGSWTSFLVTQTWLTWQRLRGDEEVKIGDVGELSSEYAIPMIALMVLLLLLLLPALMLAGRQGFNERLRPWSTGLAAPLLALLLFVFDLGTASYGLYGLSEQPLVEVIATATAPPEPTEAPLSAKAWKRLHRPTASLDEGAPPPRLSQTPKNLVLYLAEGISTHHTSFGEEVKTTPHVRRRFDDHGLWFDHYYTHTHRSIHAIFSVICSEYPPPTLDAMTALHPRIDCGSMMETLDTLPGMHQGLFHGGRFSFANKLALLSGRGFEVTRDAEDLSDPETWREDWWGIDDRAVADAALAFVDTVPEDERFFLFIIPIAPHEPYDIPEGTSVPKRIAGASEEANKYLRAVQFSDLAFERLMKGLEARGRYKDTLTVWVPDHGNHADEPARPSRGKRMLYQHNVHVPWILLHPGSFSGQRTHRLAAQIDLSPTLTAAMGADPDPRDRGLDVFSSSYVQRRVYLLKTRGSSPFVGLVDGDYKFIYDIRTKRWELYDLTTDPKELKNIAQDHLPRVRGYARDGLRFRKAQRQTLLSVPEMQESTGTAEELLKQAVLKCGEKPCPLDVKMEAKKCKGTWAHTDCLALKIAGGVPVEVILPGDIVGRYDSVRVRWWNRERQRAKKATLSLHYGERVIEPSPPRSSSDAYRVLPVPHDVLEGKPAITLRMASDGPHSPMIEFTEH